jgi:hypothetical protein
MPIPADALNILIEEQTILSELAGAAFMTNKLQPLH